MTSGYMDMLDINKISFREKFRSDKWSVVLNCGKVIALPDGTELKSFGSGLFKNIEIGGEKLLAFELGDNFEVSDEIADQCRREWTPVYEIFPLEIFKNVDFFRSPKIKLDGLEFNFWYCGEDFSCGIHDEHDFFELHTQILGRGEMQKFHSRDEGSIYHREIMSPGNTHKPFFTKERKYPLHRYKSISRCIWLAVESPVVFAV